MSSLSADGFPVSSELIVLSKLVLVYSFAWRIMDTKIKKILEDNLYTSTIGWASMYNYGKHREKTIEELEGDLTDLQHKCAAEVEYTALAQQACIRANDIAHIELDIDIVKTQLTHIEEDKEVSITNDYRLTRSLLQGRLKAWEANLVKFKGEYEIAISDLKKLRFKMSRGSIDKEIEEIKQETLQEEKSGDNPEPMVPGPNDLGLPFVHETIEEFTAKKDQ